MNLHVSYGWMPWCMASTWTCSSMDQVRDKSSHRKFGSREPKQRIPRGSRRRPNRVGKSAGREKPDLLREARSSKFARDFSSAGIQPNGSSEKERNVLTYRYTGYLTCTYRRLEEILLWPGSDQSPIEQIGVSTHQLENPTYSFSFRFDVYVCWV